MNEQAQRIAIAETQGWEPEIRKLWAGEKNVPGWGLNTHLQEGDRLRDFTTLPEIFPDYLNDRNAMIAAVLELSAPERIKFIKHLAENLGVDFYDDLLGIDETSVFMCVTAPLDKIAKAYLVVKSEWRND